MGALGKVYIFLRAGKIAIFGFDLELAWAPSLVK